MNSEFEKLADLQKCILHVDLDCYYCQVEQNRLGISSSQPLAVRQWEDLIAVNYEARKFGIKRMDSFTEAKRKCPSLRAVHVATYQEGETKPQYHDDENHPPSVRTHKASLESYRNESLKIFAILEEMSDICEKGGVDEAFLDVTQRVNTILERKDFDIADYLVCAGTIMGNLNVSTDRMSSHDLRLILASHFAHDLRERLRTELNYTCTIGIAHNKTLAKLASRLYKPDQQTVVLASGVADFIKDIPLQKIRWLGGKLGANVIENYQLETAGDLWPYSQSVLCQRYGSETGLWLWNICRGIDDSDVVARSKCKSILTYKSFPSVTSMEKIERFLNILASELGQRLREDYQRNKRHPKKLCLYCYCDSTSYNRHSPFPTHGVHHPMLIVKTALNLLTNIPTLFPCSRLGLGVNSFLDQNDAVLKTSLITQFFPKGGRRLLLTQEVTPSKETSMSCTRRKSDLRGGGGTIDKFFRPTSEMTSSDYILCEKCHQRLVKDETSLSLHADYHVALELSRQFNEENESRIRIS